MTTPHPLGPTVRLTGQQSLCRGCDRVFTSTSAFSSHRITVASAPNFKSRCMDEHELAAAGFEPNAKGLLRIPMSAETLARLKTA